ncbi:DUF2652 domain-containing protein [Dyadobacter sp. NIV53]|uniref:DUF2652 domain-containing protein n=1 Tax=Dyadobacter sp. NIV53 TaxID=2861765 RepID=UPI001C877BBD|nr:DUF2652 domain-containing protein [Dyadobacter sp. NIV53]
MKEGTKGTVFIVDISGYTRFIKETNNADGTRIIKKLFTSILKANCLFLQISEIEGDAILFYQFGKPIAVKKILAQFEKMLASFNAQVNQLRILFPEVTDLSIKVIVHYGRMSIYEIGRFFKLFGRPLVDAHRLLKNSVPSSTYVLITSEYMKELKIIGPHTQLPTGHQHCERYDVGNLCYTYFSFLKN